MANVSAPDINEFDELITEARKKARDAGIKKSDIKNAIQKARGKKK